MDGVLQVGRMLKALSSPKQLAELALLWALERLQTKAKAALQRPADSTVDQMKYYERTLRMISALRKGFASAAFGCASLEAAADARKPIDTVVAMLAAKERQLVDAVAPVPASGLKWRIVDASEAVGAVSYIKPALAAALAGGKLSFTESEWEALKIKSLRINHVVRYPPEVEASKAEASEMEAPQAEASKAEASEAEAPRGASATVEAPAQAPTTTPPTQAPTTAPPPSASVQYFMPVPIDGETPASMSDAVQLLLDAVRSMEGTSDTNEVHQEAAKLVEKLRTEFEEQTVSSAIERAVNEVHRVVQKASSILAAEQQVAPAKQMLSMLAQRIAVACAALKEMVRLAEVAGEAVNTKLPELKVAGEAVATHALRVTKSREPDDRQAAIAELKNWATSLGSFLNEAIQQKQLLRTVQAVREALLPEPAELADEPSVTEEHAGEDGAERRCGTDIQGLLRDRAQKKQQQAGGDAAEIEGAMDKALDTVKKEFEDSVQGLKLHVVNELSEAAQEVRSDPAGPFPSTAAGPPCAQIQVPTV